MARAKIASEVESACPGIGASRAGGRLQNDLVGDQGRLSEKISTQTRQCGVS